MIESGKDNSSTYPASQDPWFQIIQEAFLLGKEPESWPEPGLTGAGWQALAKDIISNLKNAQSELRSSEARYRLLAEALRNSAAALNSALGLDDILNVLLEEIERIVPHDTMEILLIDSHGIAHAAATKSDEIQLPDNNRHVFQISIPVMQIPNLAQMASSGKPLLIDNLYEFPWIRTESSSWAHSHLGAPILVKGKAVGFIILLSAKTSFFEAKFIERLEIFADQAAIAIEKARLYEQLNEMVTTDSLTEISNRRHFFNMAENELTRSIRYQHHLSALMMDIDHFKQVNDTYGHSNGDQVLHALAQRCIKTLRKNDLIGRYGGEEFSFILPETSIDVAVNVAERLRETIAKKPFAIQNGNIHITVSIGVAGFHTQIPSARALLDLADQALYQAKQTGRNRVVKA